MSRSWLGRSTGRHAAGRRPAEPPAKPQPAPAPPQPAQAPPAPASPPAEFFGAPTAPSVELLGAPPLVSPVTDEARAAVAGSAPPPFVPQGAAPLVTIDALGRKCPIPIIMLAQRIGEVPVGSVIAVLADDPAAYTDIPAWCGLKSHGCAFRADYQTGWAFGIRRRY